MALAIATEAHAGQTREGGAPYIGHPIEVARIAVDLFNAETPDPEGLLTRVHELIAVVSLAHDIEEDQPAYPLKAKLLRLVNVGLLTAQEESEVDAALDILNKHNARDYLHYILRVKDGGYLTRYPKRADLYHNSSDLKPGSRRDRYALALHILET